MSRGRVTSWSAAEIERRARITDSDIAKAANAWRRHAPADKRTILDADEVKP